MEDINTVLANGGFGFEADAIIDLIADAGYVVVPREPTVAMQAHGWPAFVAAQRDLAGDATAQAEYVWKSMISAWEDKT